MDRLRQLKPGPIAAVVAAGLLGLIAPEIYTGTFSDLGTFLLVLTMLAMVAVWVFAVRRFVPRREVRWGLIGVPLAVLAWVALWPYLRPPKIRFTYQPTTACRRHSTATTRALRRP